MMCRDDGVIKRLALALTLGLAGCAGGTRPAPDAPRAPAATKAPDIAAIVALLDQGEERAARKRIKAELKRDPTDPTLRLLRDSVEKDPKQLLGPASFAYTVRPGDTMAGLAQRFLGNRLKAYLLARYNGVAKPSALAAGAVLRIPGEPPREEPIRRSEPAAKPSPSPRPKAAPRPPATPPQAATTNPAAARQARAAGLAALNQGRAEAAVALLQRAAALDPANPLIARDLARARRVAAAVRARKGAAVR